MKWVIALISLVSCLTAGVEKQFQLQQYVNFVDGKRVTVTAVSNLTKETILTQTAEAKVTRTPSATFSPTATYDTKITPSPTLTVTPGG